MKSFLTLLLLSCPMTQAMPACEEFFHLLQSWNSHEAEELSQLAKPGFCPNYLKRHHQNHPALPESCAKVSFFKMPTDFQAAWQNNLGTAKSGLSKDSTLQDLSALFVKNSELDLKKTCAQASTQKVLRNTWGGPHPRMSPDPL